MPYDILFYNSTHFIAVLLKRKVIRTMKLVIIIDCLRLIVLYII